MLLPSRERLIEHYIQTSLQAHHGLSRQQMSMYRHLRPRLQSIQHPLRTILCRGSQIEIHSQALTRLGLFVQSSQQTIIYFLNLHVFTL